MSGRIISRAESWETAYQAFQQINFTSFDYATIKQSMIEYIKTYFPESFNDFIESSELIVFLEIFAYLGELMAYRVDMASHENFLPTAQRKQSVLRLAKLLSYNASRNVPARGLVKITSVSTNEPIIDSSGKNLSGIQIRWNDLTNPNWKTQFNLIMNRILSQPIGSVSPRDRFQVQDVLFELYNLNNIPVSKGVVPFTISISNNSYPFEIVPVALDSDGPFEKRPEINIPMSVLSGSDGLGDSSDGTGFFMFVKQGQLNYVSRTFDGVTPNQFFELPYSNINETDVWVNNVNPDTLEITSGDENITKNTKSGEWVPVDLAQSQNIIFNTNSSRNKFEIETLENDNIRIIFGDGEFSSIPKGLFHFWYRVSANEDLLVPQSSITNIPITLNYYDSANIIRTLTITVSLTNSLQNSTASEDIEHIRKIAPSVYYSQDRMVNGRDYNTFMLQDPSILKLRAVNRTFAGDTNYSEFISFNDPSGTYDNIKIFGDDLFVYLHPEVIHLSEINSSYTPEVVTRNYIEPLLSDSKLFLYRTTLCGNLAVQQVFKQEEYNLIVDSLYEMGNQEVYLLYGLNQDSTGLTEKHWYVTTITESENEPANWIIKISKGAINNPWLIYYQTITILAESPSTKFWYANDKKTINYDSLHSSNDYIVLLKANKTNDRNSLLSTNKNFVVLSQPLVTTETGPIIDVGLKQNSQLSVMYEDTDNNGLPDLPVENFYPLEDLVFPKKVLSNGFTGLLTLSSIGIDFAVPLNGQISNGITVNDIIVHPQEAINTSMGENGFSVITPGLVNGVYLSYSGAITITVKEYVYFRRSINVDEYWSILEPSSENVLQFLNDDNNQYTRKVGRHGLNFVWIHQTPNNNLIDPAATNIIDTLIITRGYYTNIKQWLNNTINWIPKPPSPLELRTTYSYLLDNKMISDSLILHSGNFKILFGSKAPFELQAKFKIIKTPTSSLADNQIKVKVVDVVNDFFKIDTWEFGETFYFTELAAAIHAALPVDIDSVVLVPQYSSNYFGDMFQVNVQEDEIVIADITTNIIEIVDSLNKISLRQNI